MCLRMEEHIILDVDKTQIKVDFIVDGLIIQGYEGEPILAALLANGIRINRYTNRKKEPRGLFCGIGQCSDCSMVVNGQPNVRTCITPLESGMIIQTQNKREKGE